jgi:F-type H+-transporting ATPase subunit c
MDNVGLIGMASIIMAGLTVGIGSVAPALAEGRGLAEALKSYRSTTR